MKLLVVRYGRERGHDDPEQAAAFQVAAEQIAELPGLIWKLWAYDDAEHVATSVYLFDSEDRAQAWGEGAMKPALSSHAGIGEIETSYFDVDEKLSAITHAPLAVAQRL